MPRRARIKCSGIPHHLIQRGNNRLACFFSDADYRFYLESLSEGARRYSCDVHAYVLMTNHVHLLVTPGEEKDLSSLMRYLGSRRRSGSELPDNPCVTERCAHHDLHAYTDDRAQLVPALGVHILWRKYKFIFQAFRL